MRSPLTALKLWARKIINRFTLAKQKIQKFRSQYRFLLNKRKKKKIKSKLLEKYHLKSVRKNPYRLMILLVIDALRQDHLSAHGYKRATTPFLNTLAEESTVFENAFAPALWTYPSISSILTGLYPHKHGGVFSKEPRSFQNFIGGDKPNKVRSDILSLPEILHDFGFSTLFLSGNTFAELAVSGWFEHQISFHADAQKMITKLRECIEKNKSKKSFIYCHLNDLHEPVSLSESYRNVFGNIPDLKNLERWDFRDGKISGHKEFESYKKARIQLYDSAIRFVDQQIHTLVRYLKENDLWNKTLFIITADHGEEFWDHAETEKKFFFDPRGSYGTAHGHVPFQELIRVPLLIKSHERKPERISKNSSLVDLVPTLLSLCGIKSEYRFSGTDLYQIPDDRAVLCEENCYGYEKKAVLYKNWKLISSRGDGVELLYDLSSDPKEKKDLSDREIKRLKQLRNFLNNFLSESTKKLSTETIKTDKKIEKQLKNLGYFD